MARQKVKWNNPVATAYVPIMWKGEEFKEMCRDALFGLIEDETKVSADDSKAMAPVASGATRDSIASKFKESKARASGTISMGVGAGRQQEVGTSDTPQFRTLRTPFNAAISRISSELGKLLG